MLQALDVEAFLRWREWSVEALALARREIDELNVFPIADADTGSNLYATLGSPIGSDAHATLRSAVRAVADAALMGARGGSGTILAQLLHGLTASCPDVENSCRGRSLARALTAAANAAYAAVSKPVEGTMLTVARAAAVAAMEASSDDDDAADDDDLHAVVAASVAAATRALAETPAQLHVLRDAGVVDAGGLGVVVLLRVLMAVVEGSQLPVPNPDRPVRSPRRHSPLNPTALREVMYLLSTDDGRIAPLRDALDLIGEAVVISGGSGRWNVHVHTADSDAAVAAGRSAGALDDVTVTALDGVAGPAVVAMPGDATVWATRGVINDAGGVLVDAGGEAAGGDGAAREQIASGAAIAVGADAAAWTTRTYPQQLVVEVASVSGLLAALAVHDRYQTAERDAAAMAAASASTRHAMVEVAEAPRALDELLTPSSELVTLVAGSGSVAADLTFAVKARHPGVVVEVLVAPDLASTVLIGVV